VERRKWKKRAERLYLMYSRRSARFFHFLRSAFGLAPTVGILASSTRGTPKRPGGVGPRGPASGKSQSSKAAKKEWQNMMLHGECGAPLDVRNSVWHQMAHRYLQKRESSNVDWMALRVLSFRSLSSCASRRYRGASAFFPLSERGHRPSEESGKTSGATTTVYWYST